MSHASLTTALLLSVSLLLTACGSTTETTTTTTTRSVIFEHETQGDRSQDFALHARYNYEHPTQSTRIYNINHHYQRNTEPHHLQADKSTREKEALQGLRG